MAIITIHYKDGMSIKEPVFHEIPLGRVFFVAHLNIGVFRDNPPRPSTPVTCDKDAGNRRKERGGDSRVSRSMAL